GPRFGQALLHRNDRTASRRAPKADARWSPSASLPPTLASRTTFRLAASFSAARDSLGVPRRELLRHGSSRLHANPVQVFMRPVLVFALRWRFQFAIRYIFATTTLGVLVLSTFYLCAELSVTTLNGLKHELPDLYVRLSSSFSSGFPALYARLSAFQLPHINEVPFKVEIGLFVLALLMFRHYLQEFLASRR